MTAVALAAAMCLMADGYRPACARARALAPLIIAEARDIDPMLIAAIAFRESSFDNRKVGKLGEVGCMQIKPDGWASSLCTRDDIRLGPGNVACAVRILRTGRRRCGEIAEALTFYGSGRCGPSRYARRVMEVLAMKRSKKDHPIVIMAKKRWAESRPGAE